MLGLEQGPAETSSYMIMGFAMIFGMMSVYLISLIIRCRNLQRDLEVLEQLEKTKK